jgi:hypothetical protein
VTILFLSFFIERGGGGGHFYNLTVRRPTKNSLLLQYGAPKKEKKTCCCGLSPGRLHIHFCFLSFILGNLCSVEGNFLIGDEQT